MRTPPCVNSCSLFIESKSLRIGTNSPYLGPKWFEICSSERPLSLEFRSCRSSSAILESAIANQCQIERIGFPLQRAHEIRTPINWKAQWLVKLTSFSQNVMMKLELFYFDSQHNPRKRSICCMYGLPVRLTSTQILLKIAVFWTLFEQNFCRLFPFSENAWTPFFGNVPALQRYIRYVRQTETATVTERQPEWESKLESVRVKVRLRVRVWDGDRIRVRVRVRVVITL